MAEIIIKLEELISEGMDSISGRHTGQLYAEQKGILKNIEVNTFKIIISPNIKAINDSFIKGFFSDVFKKYKNKQKIREKFIIEADPYFIDLFDKNYSILESINK